MCVCVSECGGDRARSGGVGAALAGGRWGAAAAAAAAGCWAKAGVIVCQSGSVWSRVLGKSGGHSLSVRVCLECFEGFSGSGSRGGGETMRARGLGFTVSVVVVVVHVDRVFGASVVVVAAAAAVTADAAGRRRRPQGCCCVVSNACPSLPCWRFRRVIDHKNAVARTPAALKVLAVVSHPSPIQQQ